MNPTLSQRSDKTCRGLIGLGLMTAVLCSSCSEPTKNASQNEGTNTLREAEDTAVTFRVASVREKQESDQRELEFHPTGDGWDSETFHGDTTTQLKLLAESLSLNRSPSILAPGGTSGVLRPDRLAAVFENGGLRIIRGPSEEAGPDRPLLDQLEGLTRPLHESAGAVSVRFKQFRVRPPTGKKSTSSSTVLYMAKSVGPAGSLLQNSTWSIDWIRDSESQNYLIKTIRPEAFEEVALQNISEDSSPAGEKTLFHDRTTDLIAPLPRGGLIHWGANELSVRGLYQNGRALTGLALGDANGDGIDDVYSPQARDLPNLFFLSQPDGSLKEVAARTGLDWLDDTIVSLFADFDNDGDQDLVIATTQRLVLHENTDGTGLRFARVLELPQPYTSSLAAADYDGDGLLDLYVCNYLDSIESETVALSDSIYNAMDGGTNRLYRNLGDLTFNDVTGTTGMDVDATRMSLAASWEDFDNDGDVDLYVANDFGPNALYRNENGKFAQVALKAGADDPSFGMSVTWGDINRDGLMDACISNMFSAAGNRITAQPKFKQSLAGGLDVDRIAYLARGNTLLVNGGRGKFEERSEQAGVVNTQWTWGTLFADFNNSGHLDLMALNGYVTGQVADDL